MLRTQRFMQSSKKCVQPLDIKLKRSTLLAVFLYVITLLALLSCWFNSLAIPIQLLLGVTVLLVAIKCYQQLFSIQKLQLKKNGIWQLTNTKGELVTATLLKTSTIFSNIIFLYFKTNQKSIQLLLVKSSFENPQHNRALRLVLNLYTETLLET